MMKNTKFWIVTLSLLSIFFTSLCNNKTDKIEKALSLAGNDSARVTLLLKFGNEIQDSRPNEAISLYTEAINIAEDHNSEYFMFTMAKCFNRLGIVNTIQSNVQKAVLNYEKALDIFTILSDRYPDNSSYKEGKLNISANIGAIFYHQENYAKALEYWNNALKSIRELGLSYSEALLLNNIGIIYKEIYNYGQALDSYNKALEIFKIENSPKDIAMCYTNIGEIYTIMRKYSEALNILNKSFEIKKEINDKNGQVQCLYSIAETYFAMNDFPASQNFALQCTQLAAEINDKNSLKRAYYILSQCYAENNNYKMAYDSYVLFKEMNDSIFNAENQQRILEMELRYESEKNEKELELLREREEHQLLVRKYLIAGIVLVSIIFILMVLSIITKRKREKTIYEKDKQLHKQEKQLMNSELEKKELKTKELNQEIEFKTKQLTTHALNIMQKNKILVELYNSIETVMKSADGSKNEQLRTLKLQVKRNLKTEKDWDVFKLYFEQVNKNFFNKLTAINSELNTYDLRQCALIKLNMNIKETASVLNLSPNSIKSARYRLKKKLGLNHDDDLFEFIRTLT